MVQAHDHVGCETCLDALIELEARVDALPGKRAASARVRKRDEAYRAMVDALTRYQTWATEAPIDDLEGLAECAERAEVALALARRVGE